MKENLIGQENAINQLNISEDTFSLTQEFKEDEDDLPEVSKKSCCSCWCCLETIEISKNYFRKDWRKFLINEGEDSADESFQMLTKLFLNEENAIEGLQNLRLNPNLVSENKLRNDLEFYIPQLCTFLLFGEMKTIEEFFVFLCKVCNTSFFFAHRVHWFLSAMINFADDKKDEVINVLKMVNTLFKSENKKSKNKLDKFYIANSENYLDYVKNNNLYFLYDNIDEKNNIFDKIDFNSLTMPQQEIFNKYKNTREAIIEFSQIEYIREKNNIINKLKHTGKSKYSGIIHKNEIDEEKDLNESHLLKVGQKFKPDEIFIDISNFKLNAQDITQQEEDELFDIQEKEDEKSSQSGSKQDLLYNENNSEDFMSDLDIINLSGTSGKDINFISFHSTLNFIEHLCDISTDLPKYPIEEQQLFLLKKINEINKKLPCNVYLPFLKDSTRNYLICHIPIDDIKIFRTKTRCPIMLTFEMIRIDEINQQIKQNNFEIANDRKTFNQKEINIFKRKKDDNKLLLDIITEEKTDYDEADYDLSKPLKIGNDDQAIKDDINNKGKKSNKNHNNKDTEQLDNNRYLKIVNKFLSQNKLINFEHRRINTLYFRDRPYLDDLESINSTRSKIKPKNKKKEIINERPENEEVSDISEGSGRSLRAGIENINKSLNYQDFSNIFGQSFYEKEKSLKSKSLFGDFKTYKIFSCIFKTHEDLRQEQFATQLINEFHQIFRLEKVDCWLNTYEIISTGHDSGLVEMVNDSLSLDQLKHKLNNLSLHDFYLYYWGNGHIDSPEYKKAMNNYVESLAGYSLICYFLQIKDRHNGNILIDKEGHLTHIDFGFLLSNAPGKGLKFENAPFKLSRDMVQNLGGDQGQYFEQFRKLLKKGFWAVHKHREKIIILVEMMWCGNGRNLDCFEKGQETIDLLRERLAPNNCDKKADIFKFVDSLIEQSVDNWRTKWYHIFQYYVQGIFY